MKNSIRDEQNSELQLSRLAAQRSLYSSAKRLFVWHAGLSTLVASCLAFSAMIWDGVKPWAAAWGLTLSVLDLLWLNPRQKKLREAAALIQESFDCDVLGLPWTQLAGCKPVDRELVSERAAIYRRKEPTLESLRNWYPAAVCGMPLFLARVVCQRINAWWDGTQRRRYAYALLSVVVVLLLGLLAFAIVRNLMVPDLLMSVVAPLSSGVLLAIRQFRENEEAAGRLDKLKERAMELLARAVNGVSETELAQLSRTLQDELFDHRKRNVPVPDWVYWRVRKKQEVQMREAAESMARDLMSSYERSQSSRTSS